MNETGTSNEYTQRGWIKHYLIPAALVLGATLISVLVFELSLRMVAERPSLASEWMMSKPTGFDDEVLFAGPLFMSESNYQIDSDLPTVVALGDSFTWGYPVGRSNAYPAILSTLLQDHGMPANVVAVGMGDSGPDLQLRVFERELLSRVTPDVVVWQFFPNDEWDNIVKAVYTIGDQGLILLDVTRNWLYRRQKFYDRMPFGTELKQHSYLFRYLLKTARFWKTSHVPLDDEAEMRSWAIEKIRLGVERMNEHGRTFGFRPVYVLVAPQAYYLTGDDARKPSVIDFRHAYERMHAILQVQPGFIDARFDDESLGVRAERIFVGEDRDNLAVGGRHFNEQGYHLLAELVESQVFGGGQIP